MTNSSQAPTAKAQMLIRRPVATVFEAFVDPAKGGFSFVLAGLKALLEHGIELTLVVDHAPDHLVAGWTAGR